LVAQREGFLPRRHVPDPDGFSTVGGQARAVAAVYDVGDLVARAAQDAALPRGEVPDFHGAIGAAQGEALAVRTEGDLRDADRGESGVGAGADREHDVAAGDVVQADDADAVPRRQPLSLEVEGHADDRVDIAMSMKRLNHLSGLQVPRAGNAVVIPRGEEP